MPRFDGSVVDCGGRSGRRPLFLRVCSSGEHRRQQGGASDETASAPLEPPEEAFPSKVAMYTLRKVLPGAPFALISQEVSAQSAAFDYVLNRAEHAVLRLGRRELG